MANNTVMITTIDNPWNPFKDFDKWYQYDETHGYRTMGVLARIARISPELSDSDNDAEIDRAIDSVCKLDPFGIYRKVYENSYK